MLKPVSAGHAHVGEYGVCRSFPEQLERFPAVRGLQNLEPLHGQFVLENVAKIHLIIDNQNCGHWNLAFPIHLKAVLFSLIRIRMGGQLHDFSARMRSAFSEATIGVGMRNLDGMAMWGNKQLEKLHGSARFDDGPVDLLVSYDPEARAILRARMNAERRGMVTPYSLPHVNKPYGDVQCLRCYPCLVLPKEGNAPVFVPTYVSDMDRDSDANYFEYCAGPLRCLDEKI